MRDASGPMPKSFIAQKRMQDSALLYQYLQFMCYVLCRKCDWRDHCSCTKSANPGLCVICRPLHGAIAVLRLSEDRRPDRAVLGLTFVRLRPHHGGLSLFVAAVLVGSRQCYKSPTLLVYPLTYQSNSI
jgi:hypothetical protein